MTITSLKTVGPPHSIRLKKTPDLLRIPTHRHQLNQSPKYAVTSGLDRRWTDKGWDF